MPRLLFTKTGEAVWMSHLDLMRLFQRAFKRAGLPLTHTQGYNPRPSVSIALPLSVGVESQCEMLDFDLEGEGIPYAEITARLNAALIPGVQVLRSYPNGRKIREIALLQCALTLEYDHGVSDEQIEGLKNLFASQSLLVEKKGKNGPVQQDITPMIRSLQVTREDGDTVHILALICCQNPSLNPMQLVAAIEAYAPELMPNHTRCIRMDIFDEKEKQFR